MRDSFPNNDFSIRLRYTDYVMDASENSTEPGSEIVLWTRRDENNENQKWIYENKQIINKKTRLVLAAPQLTGNIAVDQQHSSGSDTQRFEYYDYTISASANEDLVLGIVGSVAEGVRVALVPRDNDSELQQWEIIE